MAFTPGMQDKSFFNLLNSGRNESDWGRVVAAGLDLLAASRASGEGRARI
jgi:hypothetical protein